MKILAKCLIGLLGFMAGFFGLSLISGYKETGDADLWPDDSVASTELVNSFFWSTDNPWGSVYDNFLIDVPKEYVFAHDPPIVLGKLSGIIVQMLKISQEQSTGFENTHSKLEDAYNNLLVESLEVDEATKTVIKFHCRDFQSEFAQYFGDFGEELKVIFGEERGSLILDLANSSVGRWTHDFGKYCPAHEIHLSDGKPNRYVMIENGGTIINGTSPNSRYEHLYDEVLERYLKLGL